MGEKKRAGRKSKYETHVKPKLLLIAAWCRDGLSYGQIAKNLNISVDSLERYKENFADFAEALRVGREEADVEVENAVFKGAIGYEYTEKKTVREDGIITKEEETVKFIPGCSSKQQYWLNNRKPSVWSTKQKLEHSGNVDIKVILGGNPEEWQ